MNVRKQKNEISSYKRFSRSCKVQNECDFKGLLHAVCYLGSMLDTSCAIVTAARRKDLYGGHSSRMHCIPPIVDGIPALGGYSHH